jgi:hypothetical protein
MFGIISNTGYGLCFSPIHLTDEFPKGLLSSPIIWFYG